MPNKKPSLKLAKISSIFQLITSIIFALLSIVLAIFIIKILLDISSKENNEGLQVLSLVIILIILIAVEIFSTTLTIFGLSASIPLINVCNSSIEEFYSKRKKAVISNSLGTMQGILISGGGIFLLISYVENSSSILLLGIPLVLLGLIIITLSILSFINIKKIKQYIETNA